MSAPLSACKWAKDAYGGDEWCTVHCKFKADHGAPLSDPESPPACPVCAKPYVERRVILRGHYYIHRGYVDNDASTWGVGIVCSETGDPAPLLGQAWVSRVTSCQACEHSDCCGDLSLDHECAPPLPPARQSAKLTHASIPDVIAPPEPSEPSEDSMRRALELDEATCPHISHLAIHGMSYVTVRQTRCDKCVAFAFERVRQDEREKLIDRIVGTLKAYPDGGGDINIMAEVDRLLRDER